MRRTWRSLSLSLGLLVVLPFACKGEPGEDIDRDLLADELGQVVCAAFSSCACDSVAIGNAAECVGALRPSLERAIVEGENYGLRFFPQCLDTADAYLDALGCEVSIDDDDPALQQAAFDAGICKLLAGDAGKGDPCTSVGALL